MVSQVSLWFEIWQSSFGLKTFHFETSETYLSSLVMFWVFRKCVLMLVCLTLSICYVPGIVLCIHFCIVKITWVQNSGRFCTFCQKNQVIRKRKIIHNSLLSHKQLFSYTYFQLTIVHRCKKKYTHSLGTFSFYSVVSYKFLWGYRFCYSFKVCVSDASKANNQKRQSLE